MDVKGKEDLIQLSYGPSTPDSIKVPKSIPDNMHKHLLFGWGPTRDTKRYRSTRNNINGP